MWEAGFALEFARAHAERGDLVACVGTCAFAVVAVAQARLLERGEWALNEKGIVDRAGLRQVEDLLARTDDLMTLVGECRRALALTD